MSDSPTTLLDVLVEAEEALFSKFCELCREYYNRNQGFKLYLALTEKEFRDIFHEYNCDVKVLRYMLKEDQMKIVDEEYDDFISFFDESDFDRDGLVAETKRDYRKKAKRFKRIKNEVVRKVGKMMRDFGSSFDQKTLSQLDKDEVKETVSQVEELIESVESCVQRSLFRVSKFN